MPTSAAAIVPVRVKICGVTSIEDARVAVAAGADALGFMFYPGSQRVVAPELVRRIVAELPPFVARVGVFVDASEEEIRRRVQECGLDTIQLHGIESAGFCRRFAPISVVKAFRVGGPEAIANLEEYGEFAWLLDSYVPGVPGGTGRTFNWELAAQAVRSGGRVLLAGGLTPQNVAAAVTTVRPYAVDVSSGVESAPGRKCPEKVRAFVVAAKTA